MSLRLAAAFVTGTALTLSAQQPQPGLPPGAPGMSPPRMPRRATRPGKDLGKRLIVTTRGAVARGVVTTDEGIPPPVRPEQITVFARPADSEPMPMIGGETTVNPDFTFEITGLSESRLFVGNAAEEDWCRI